MVSSSQLGLSSLSPTQFSAVRGPKRRRTKMRESCGRTICWELKPVAEDCVSHSEILPWSAQQDFSAHAVPTVNDVVNHAEERQHQFSADDVAPATTADLFVM